MQILQVKTQNDFNTANPGVGTVLIWPEVITSGDDAGKVILHSKTASGVMKEIGTGFGQEVDIKTDADISSASVSTSVIPYLKLNEDNEVELVAKKSDGSVIQVAGGGSGFGKPSNIITDSAVSTPASGKITPYFRDNNGEAELVVKTSSGDIVAVGGSDMIPAICIGVDEETGTCTAMAVELTQNLDGTVTSKYTGKKVTGLIYTWDTPTREDLQIEISGYSVSEVNGTYTLEDEYNFEEDRIWINDVTSNYVLKFDSTGKCWKLYSDVQSDISVSYETTGAENPYDSEASWTNSVVCELVPESSEESSASE